MRLPDLIRITSGNPTFIHFFLVNLSESQVIKIGLRPKKRKIFACNPFCNIDMKLKKKRKKHTEKNVCKARKLNMVF